MFLSIAPKNIARVELLPLKHFTNKQSVYIIHVNTEHATVLEVLWNREIR